MSVKEVKIRISELKIGMYVCRLDRPWIETPYVFQGIRIQSVEDIQELAKYCHFVFIDINKTILYTTNKFLKNKNKGAFNKSVTSSSVFSPETNKELVQYRKCTYKTTSSFETELTSAKVMFDHMYEQTEVVFKSLKKNKVFDLVTLKYGINSMVDSVVRNPSALSLLVQLKKTDAYSYSHALGTSVWCIQFGRHLGLTKKDLNTLALGGILLDVGKLKMPDSLIDSSHRFSTEERESVKQHVKIGVSIIKKIPDLGRSVLEMLMFHHERYDGSGYLSGINHNKIPLLSRIAGIVDSYDAMTSKRFYAKKTYTPHEAMNELYDLRGKLFQAELVEQFIQTVGLYPAGSLVELSTGEVAIVTEVNELKRLRPRVMLILDDNKKLYNEFVMLDLARVTGIQVKRGLESGAYGIKMDELFL